MSQINTMRAAIHAAITAIPALSSLEIIDALLLEHAYGLTFRKPGLVLVYLGTAREGTSPLSSRTSDASVFRWGISIVTDNWQTPIGALTKTLGIEEIAEALRGTPGAETGLRATKLLTIGSDDVYLQFVSESVVGPPDRPERAGPAALVQEWKTNEVIL